MSNFQGRNYVNGMWGPHRPDFFSLDPAKDHQLAWFPETDRGGVEEAVEAARLAQKSWKAVSRVKRSDYFDNLAQLIKRDHDKLVEAISLETGKSLNESHAEVIESLHMVQYVAGSGRTPFGEVIASELSTKDAYTMRKPKGVVAVVSPWNFPLAIGSFWCSAPAICEGNCVVHKPSELTPMVAQLAANLYEEAGFPAGVYNLIHGADKTGAALVEADVDCILFTGSAEVGQKIRQHCASTWHKTCSCELGSKSAVIVFSDGDFDLALDATLASAFKLSGQRCVSSGRILVQRHIFDKFVEAFTSRLSDILVDNPFVNPNWTGLRYGPVISQQQLERVESYNNMVRADGVKILYDPDKNGRLEGSNYKGYFLRPFVYTCDWNDKPYLKQEVFGPHVAIVPFSTESQAIQIYNDTDYGLALGVITNDFRVMRKCRDECNYGMLYLNGGSIAAESHLPFGGVGKSGNGYKSASGTYRAVTEEVSVTTNYETGKVSWAQGMK